MSDSLDSCSPRSPVAPASYWSWIVLGLAGVTLVAFRLHAFDLPLEPDECNYAYIGARLLAGDSLYVDVWDHQPFGVFALFAGAMAVFGDEPHVFRWLAVAFSLGSLLLVFKILRRSSGDGAAVAGAMLFAIVSSDPGSGGEGCNREIFMCTFILAGWYLAMRARGGSAAALVGAGLALAVGSTFKTIVAVHWLVLAVWIGVCVCRKSVGSARWSTSLRSLGLFALGPAVVWGAVFGYFALTDRLEPFIDAVFRFNLGYSGGSEPFVVRFARFFAPIRHPFIFESALPLWMVGAAAAGALGWIARRSETAALILALVVASFVAICLPGRFWPHYYYLLIPVLAIAVPIAISHGVRVAVGDGRRRRIGEALLFGIVGGFLLLTQSIHYLSQPPFGITVKRYNSRDFWGRGQGENVRGVTDPNDSIFVFGNDPSIYYYAKRRCASRYTMITGLAEGMPGAQRRRRNLIDDLQRDPPRLILVVFDEEPFDEWKAFLRAHYTEPVGWDFHDKKTDKLIMFVLARKDRPVDAIDWNWDRSSVGG